MVVPELTAEQALRAAINRVRAKMLRACLAMRMPRERALACAARAASNYAEARRRIALANMQRRGEATSTASTAAPTHGGRQPPAGLLRIVQCTPLLEDRIRRDYRNLAPYIERVEEFARIAESLRRGRPSCSSNVSLEFSSPTEVSGEEESLVFIDDEAFFQRTHKAVCTRVSDVFSMPSCSTPRSASAQEPAVVAIARLLSGRFSHVWNAMSTEALVRSNTVEVGSELYFSSTTSTA